MIDDVLVPMAPLRGIDRRLLLFRESGREFSEREKAMLALARPTWPSSTRVVTGSSGASRTEAVARVLPFMDVA